MIDAVASIYSLKFPTVVAYMLQSCEYQIGPYLKWFWRTNNFKRVIHRRGLEKTRRAKIVLWTLRVGMAAQAAIAFYMAVWGLANGRADTALLAIPVFLATPFIWSHIILIPIAMARYLVVKPQDIKNIQKSQGVFKSHKAVKIAVAGSYGKTTMKEMLQTVLSEGKKVAATPANKNVASEHAKFAKKLSGDEDILIIEFGEGAPGDVESFAETLQPDIAVITGLAPAHLDKYLTLEAAAKDIFSLSNYVKPKNLYVNSEPEAIKQFLKKTFQTYNAQSAGGWNVSNTKISLGGTSFSLKKGTASLNIDSHLLGRHQVGPLAAVAALADKLGLSKNQIEAGIAKIEPFEHRMKPRKINGAWIIDDTYNGNIEGMKAGLEFLKGLKAKRKIYITPGLVDQGEESKKIHKQLGEAIAKANSDMVVLMEHSVTPWIKAGLKKAGYKGQLRIDDDPLHFYNNLDQFIAAGDVVLLQNDWPDQYH